MTRINLLGPATGRGGHGRREWWASSRAMGVTAAALAGIATGVAAWSAGILPEPGGDRGLEAAVQGQPGPDRATEAAAPQARRDVVQDARDPAGLIQRAREQAVRLLSAVARRSPDDVRLTAIVLGPAGATLSGRALSLATLAAFVEALAVEPVFAAVRVVSSRSTASADREAPGPGELEFVIETEMADEAANRLRADGLEHQAAEDDLASPGGRDRRDTLTVGLLRDLHRVSRRLRPSDPLCPPCCRYVWS